MKRINVSNVLGYCQSYYNKPQVIIYHLTEQKVSRVSLLQLSNIFYKVQRNSPLALEIREFYLYYYIIKKTTTTKRTSRKQLNMRFGYQNKFS